MPSKTPHVCPRCMVSATTTPLCTTCTRASNQGYEKGRKERDAEYLKLYNSPRYKRMRKVYLAQHPTCEICEIAWSNEIDHITPIKKGGAFFDTNNWQALCKPCHSAKSVAEGSRWG